MDLTSTATPERTLPDFAPALRPAPSQDGLPAATLRPKCDPEKLGFATTADLAPLEDAPGQERALAAIRFGLEMRRDGYNIFALGPPGIGKRTAILSLTRRQAQNNAVPADLLYVNNFEEPHKPRVLMLPAGLGTQLREDMRRLINELRVAIPAAFESEDYRTRRHLIDEQFKETQEKAFVAIQERARERNIGIMRTPLGMGLGPIRDGEVLAPEELRKLAPAEQEHLQKDMATTQDELQDFIRHVPQWESERREKVRELNREIIGFAVGHMIERIEARYGGLTNVGAYLKIVRDDLMENAAQFLMPAGHGGDGTALDTSEFRSREDNGFFDRYSVNLLVDRSASQGAPVVEEDHPTVPNLLGRIEYRPHFGALVTDFTLIKAGALHRANGGYLVLDARRILMQPFAWEELKRALRTREIRIRSVGESLGLLSTATLEPEETPLDVKIVLTGDRQLWYLLSAYDPDVPELFKVAADFEDDTARVPGSEVAYSRLIARLARDGGLRPLDRYAVARVVDEAARLAGDNEKLTSQIETLCDLLREADHLAGQAGSKIVREADVAAAREAQIRRLNRLRDRVQEAIRRNIVMIEVKGTRVGQVNGLSVVELGGFAFGRPSRISARVRVGKGEVVDIEREVELGGPLHSKGVMILAGFLGERYARRRPLSLAASLVFEQSYAGIEGDSASMAELCAILSAISRVPLQQGIAITGSVNQYGEAQAVGGINEKIEGFFDVCNANGLTGDQGVIIPRSNVKQLMLREDVATAVSRGLFHVWTVGSVDETMELLTGFEVGAADGEGDFPEGTVNFLAAAELQSFAEAARSFIATERQSGPS